MKEKKIKIFVLTLKKREKKKSNIFNEDILKNILKKEQFKFNVIRHLERFLLIVLNKRTFPNRKILLYKKNYEFSVSFVFFNKTTIF